jgi:H+/Cl- antiporter ClcA
MSQSFHVSGSIPPASKSGSSGPTTAQPSTSRRRLFVVAGLAGVIGLAAGVAAWALYGLITFVSNLFFYQQASAVPHDPAGHHLGVLILLVPALGGLLVGALARWGTSKIRGHGIPEAMEAVLFNESRIAPSVALLKPISVAIAIGTGGPFGAEGPIIQTGGALGSTLGQALHLTASERKVLLASGAAAGMAATFSTPIAAILLALELLLFEYRARSFVPLVVASTLATAVRFGLMGRGAMFTVGVVDFGIPWALPWYLPLGLLAGLAAVGLSRALYWVEDQFERLPINEMWWPAIGGLGLGVIAWFVPRVLGVGYDTISDILNARMAMGALAIIMIAKAVALLVSLGSGTSGGLLAPTFMIGAALGGLYAGAINQFVPGIHLSSSACALIAMAALFGAAARAPLTFIVFAFELTRDYDAVLPLMLVVATAHAVAVVFMRHSIMTEKLARRGLHVHQEYEVDVFRQVSVEAVMDRQPLMLPGTVPVVELAERVAAGEPALTRHQAWLLSDERGKLAGIITRGDLVRALERDEDETMTALEAGTKHLHVAYPDESLHDALHRMLHFRCGRLPVLSREAGGALVGYLGRAAVLEARLRRMHDDTVRQPGWLQSMLRPDSESTLVP